MKVKINYFVLGVLLAIFLGGCATAVPKITQTSSGKPEVVINTTNTDQIKAEIINKMMNEQYQLVKDTSYLLEFNRPANSNENLAAALSIGNSYSNNSRVATFTIINNNETTKIIVSLSLQAQMPMGQINTMPLNNNGNVYNIYQNMLFDIKNRVESGK
jgi:hypothetical protein